MGSTEDQRSSARISTISSETAALPQAGPPVTPTLSMSSISTDPISDSDTYQENTKHRQSDANTVSATEYLKRCSATFQKQQAKILHRQMQNAEKDRKLRLAIWTTDKVPKNKIKKHNLKTIR